MQVVGAETKNLWMLVRRTPSKHLVRGVKNIDGRAAASENLSQCRVGGSGAGKVVAGSQD